MYRFLIVEDDQITREQVTRYLQDAFPGAVVLAAETVDGGKELIEKVERPFDCVILDFKLPKEKGGTHAGDVSLCDLVREFMPSAIVAHVSAYLRDDEALQQHIRVCHNELVDPRAIVLPKDEDWVARLGTMLKAYFYGDEIRRQLDDLFGREGEEALAKDGPAERRNGPRPVGDTTYLLAQVSQDITSHWDDLDNALKQRIRRLFKVVEEPGHPPRVGLL